MNLSHQQRTICARERHLGLPLIDHVAWLQALDGLRGGQSLEFEGYVRHPDSALEYMHELFSQLEAQHVFSPSVVSRAFSSETATLRSPAQKEGFQLRLDYIVPSDPWFSPWLRVPVLNPDFSRVRDLHHFAVTQCTPDLDDRAVARSLREKARTLGLKIGEIRSGHVGEGVVIE